MKTIKNFYILNILGAMLLLFHSCNKMEIAVKEEIKYVVITVDDAPNFPEETEDLLNIFSEYNIEATFFCIGNALRKEPMLATRIAKEHILSNHTMSHPHLNTCDCFSYDVHIGQYVCDSVNIANDRSTNTYFRPPYGEINTLQTDNLKSTGLGLVMWDISAEDWNPDIEPDYIYNTIMNQIWEYEIPIILFHLGDNTEEGLIRILEQFKKDNVKVISLRERKLLLTK